MRKCSPALSVSHLNRDNACQARGGGLHFENVHRPKRAKVKVTDAKSTARMMRKRWQVVSLDPDHWLFFEKWFLGVCFFDR
jgi:hypothetical protein